MFKSLTVNEVVRLVQAIQGFTNSNFCAMGFRKLFKNYVRPYRAKLPKSFYQIPFHKELSIFFFRLMTINPALMNEMLNNKDGDIGIDFALFIYTRLIEIKDMKGNDATDKNLMFLLVYTLFYGSGIFP